MLLKSPVIQGLSLRLPGVCAVTLMLGLAACSDSSGLFSHNALEPQPPGTQKSTGEANRLQTLSAAHKANPADADAALVYAKALRKSGAKGEALTVIEAAAKAKPGDRQLALERGLITLELGEPAKAEKLLRSAHDPKAPDWRLHSALGAALAIRGKQQDAQAQFAKALALAPNHPSILNNLAISYALDGKAGEAEKLLRTAAAAKANPDSAKMQQNLALVLGLGGKYSKSRTVGNTALPVDKATANAAYLQRLAEARAAAKSIPTADDQGRREAANASLAPPTYQLGAPLQTRK